MLRGCRMTGGTVSTWATGEQMASRFRIGRLAGLSAGVLLCVLLVPVPPARAAVFTPSNPNSVAVPGSLSVEVSGAGGLITDVDVTLHSLNHDLPDDLDIVLVGPSGVSVVLASDVCGSTPVAAVDLVFNDAATQGLRNNGPCNSGAYVPSNVNDGVDSWPAAAPAGRLGAFNGDNPNGIWTLHLLDDLAGHDDGELAMGFGLTITTSTFNTLIPGTGTTGPATPYPVPLTIANRLGKVTRVTLSLRFSHSAVGDMDILLLAPSGRRSWVTSDACGDVAETNVVWTFDDSRPASLPPPGAVSSPSQCDSGQFHPADHADGDPDLLPAPAPSPPYAASFATFKGSSPNGTWHLFANDDSSDGGGFITAVSLSIATTDVVAPNTTITKRPRTSHRHRATVRFASTEGQSRFQCRVDGRSWRACASPLKLTGLPFGRHKVKVRAIDAAGNVDPEPARAKWRVKRPRGRG